MRTVNRIDPPLPDDAATGAQTNAPEDTEIDVCGDQMRRMTDRAHGGLGAACCHRTDGFIIGANIVTGPETRKASPAATIVCEVRGTSG
jgi:hypothetical protein